MPLYEYRCESCGHTFEVIQRFSDPPVSACQMCGGPVLKVLSAPAIQFKGTGWYITDYARKGSGSSENGKEKPASGETPSSPASSSSDVSAGAGGTNPAKEDSGKGHSAKEGSAKD